MLRGFLAEGGGAAGEEEEARKGVRGLVGGAGGRGYMAGLGDGRD